MTKVSVFGQEATESKQLKPIEFVKVLTNNGSVNTSLRDAKSWDNVQLFRKSEGYKYDIIIAWDNSLPQYPMVYLGHWNDGVI